MLTYSFGRLTTDLDRSVSDAVYRADTNRVAATAAWFDPMVIAQWWLKCPSANWLMTRLIFRMCPNFVRSAAVHSSGKSSGTCMPYRFGLVPMRPPQPSHSSGLTSRAGNWVRPLMTPDDCQSTHTARPTTRLTCNGMQCECSLVASKWPEQLLAQHHFHLWNIEMEFRSIQCNTMLAIGSIKNYVWLGKKLTVKYFSPHSPSQRVPLHCSPRWCLALEATETFAWSNSWIQQWIQRLWSLRTPFVENPEINTTILLIRHFPRQSESTVFLYGLMRIWFFKQPTQLWLSEKDWKKMRVKANYRETVVVFQQSFVIGFHLR